MFVLVQHVESVLGFIVHIGLAARVVYQIIAAVGLEVDAAVADPVQTQLGVYLQHYH